jgi:hypothetical protein
MIMTSPTIRDLADKSTTAEAYAELCRECGTDAITEENAILSAAAAPHPAGTPEQPPGASPGRPTAT